MKPDGIHVHMRCVRPPSVGCQGSRSMFIPFTLHPILRSASKLFSDSSILDIDVSSSFPISLLSKTCAEGGLRYTVLWRGCSVQIPSHAHGPSSQTSPDQVQRLAQRLQLRLSLLFLWVASAKGRSRGAAILHLDVLVAEHCLSAAIANLSACSGARTR
jgi:hypothetical protein